MKDTEMTKTILVTGGTGFIGSWCIAQLLERGYHVRTTIRDASKAAKVRTAIATEIQADDRLSFALADLTSDDGWDAAMQGCDGVLHVASPLGGNAETSGDALIAPARDGTLRVLRAAVKAGVKRVVMTSAAATARPPRGSAMDGDESIWSDPDDPAPSAFRAPDNPERRSSRTVSTTQTSGRRPGAPPSPPCTLPGKAGTLLAPTAWPPRSAFRFRRGRCRRWPCR